MDKSYTAIQTKEYYTDIKGMRNISVNIIRVSYLEKSKVKKSAYKWAFYIWENRYRYIIYRDVQTRNWKKPSEEIEAWWR